MRGQFVRNPKNWVSIFLCVQGLSFIGNISIKRLSTSLKIKKTSKFVIYLKSLSWLLLPNHYENFSLPLKNEKSSWYTSNHGSKVEVHLNNIKSRCPKRQKFIENTGSVNEQFYSIRNKPLKLHATIALASQKR